MGLWDYGYGERKKKQKKSSSDMGGVIFFVLIAMLILSGPIKIIRIFLPLLIALAIAGGLVYGVYWIFS